MKQIFLLLFVWISLNASSEYKLKYDLYSNHEKIGVLEASCSKNDVGAYKYATKIDIVTSYMFMEYKYFYTQEAYVQDDKLLSLFIFQKEDGEIKKVRAITDGDYLVYSDGLKIDLKKIDYLPFDFKPQLFKVKLEKNFTLKTFDPLNGNIFKEQNHLSKKVDGKYYLKTVGLDNFKEEKVFLADGTIEYIQNELFEARLVK